MDFAGYRIFVGIRSYGELDCRRSGADPIASIYGWKHGRMPEKGICLSYLRTESPLVLDAGRLNFLYGAKITFSNRIPNGVSRFYVS